MRRIVALVLAAVLTVLAAVFTASAAPARSRHHPRAGHSSSPPYMDASLPIGARVRDLMSRMTLQEKVGQMDQIVLGRLRAASDPGNGDCNGDNTTQLQPSCLQRVLVTYNVGSILSGGTDNPPDNTGRGWANLYNTVQRYA